MYGVQTKDTLNLEHDAIASVQQARDLWAKNFTFSSKCLREYVICHIAL